MKFPWSKTKYPYTKYSAPVTGGILRNGKGASATDRVKNRGEMRVTFSAIPSRQLSSSKINSHINRAALDPPGPQKPEAIESNVQSKSRPKDEQAWRNPSRQTGSSTMNFNAVRAALDPPELTKPEASASAVRVRARSEEEYPQRLRRKETKYRRRSGEGQSDLGDRPNGTKERDVDDRSNGSKKRDVDVRSNDRKKTHTYLPRSTSNRSILSERSLDESPASPEKPKRRLRDMTPDKIASSYGKWESNETIETADISDTGEDSRSRPRLSDLIDEKIEAKVRREKEEQTGRSI